MFSQTCIKNSVHGGGVCLSACWHTHTPLGRRPPGQTPTSQTPPWSDTHLDRHPLGRHPLADTPRQTPPGRHPWADTPGQTPHRQTSPWADTSRVDTPRADTPRADTPWADIPLADTPPGRHMQLLFILLVRVVWKYTRMAVKAYRHTDIKRSIRCL